MLKKLFLSSIFLFFLALPAFADNPKVTLYFFNARGCPHCSDEEKFLETLKTQYPSLEIKSLEVTANPENAQILEELGQKLQIKITGVPFTVIGKNYYRGFYDANTTGAEIKKGIDCAITTHCQDLVAPLISPSPQNPQLPQIPQILKVPLIGHLSLQNLSLPVITVIIGLLDGFNPCAMWVLLFLISLLIGLKDRRKMLLLGFTFIASSALTYFLFMAAWLNLFLFLGFISWIRALIGLVALAAGLYNLRDYFLNPEGGCDTKEGAKRQKIFAGIQKVTSQRNLFLAIFGLIILGFSVNLIEVVCSAGLPAIYTQILTLNHLSRLQYYLYLLLYIFFYMLDDLIVFTVAVTALKTIGLERKYSRFSHLIGGALMVIIGLLMLLKPEVLMFG